MLAELHFAEDALALHLLFQGPKRLIHVIVPNHYLHVRHHLSVIWVFQELRYIQRGRRAVHPLEAICPSRFLNTITWRMFVKKW